MDYELLTRLRECERRLESYRRQVAALEAQLGQALSTIKFLRAAPYQ